MARCDAMVDSAAVDAADAVDGAVVVPLLGPIDPTLRPWRIQG